MRCSVIVLRIFVLSTWLAYKLWRDGFNRTWLWLTTYSRFRRAQFFIFSGVINADWLLWATWTFHFTRHFNKIVI